MSECEDLTSEELEAAQAVLRQELPNMESLAKLLGLPGMKTGTWVSVMLADNDGRIAYSIIACAVMSRLCGHKFTMAECAAAYETLIILRMMKQIREGDE